jgi:hypothetical protein
MYVLIAVEYFCSFEDCKAKLGNRMLHESSAPGKERIFLVDDTAATVFKCSKKQGSKCVVSICFNVALPTWSSVHSK